MSNVMLEQMISESVSQSRVVRAADVPSLRGDLEAWCEDSADGAGETEFWGTAEDGGEWRIHLVTGSTRRGYW